MIGHECRPALPNVPGVRARKLAWAGPALAVALGLWLTSPAWGPRPPAGDDVMALIVRIEDGLRVLGSGHLDGWSSSFLTGHPQFLHYGPGLAAAAGALQVLTLGLLSVPGTLSVLFVVSYLAVAPAVWFLGRSLGLTRLGAAIAAVLSLTVDSPYGVGLSGLYETGLVTHSLVAPFVCLAIGAAVRIVTEPKKARWPVLLAVSLAVVIATHVISTLVLPILAAGCVATAVAVRRTAQVYARDAGVDLRGWAWVRPMAGGVLGGIGLAAFWLLPFLTHLGDRGDITTWPTPSFFGRAADVLAGRILFPHAWLAWLVLAGWVWVILVGRRRRPLLLSTPAAATGVLLFAHALHSWFPSNEVGLQLANRGLGYAGLLAVVPLAAMIADLAVRPALGLAVAAAVLIAASGALRDIPGQQGAAHPAMAQTAATLRELVPNGARFATDRDFPDEVARLGVRHPDFWLAERSGRNTLNTFGVELSASPEARFLTEFLKTPHELVDTSAGAFARHGVTHIVTLVPATTARLLEAGGFKPVAAHGPLTVLEVVVEDGQPSPASLVTVDHGSATASLTSWRDGGEDATFRVDSSQLTTASLAVGWARAWRVTIDDQRIPVLRRPDGLVGVTLPGGPHELVLRFHRPDQRAAAAGPLISLATLAAGLGWTVRRARAAPRVTA